MRRYTGLLFVLPALIVLGMLILYPMVYTAVLIGSGLIAAYYLFVCPGTRIIQSRTTDAP